MEHGKIRAAVVCERKREKKRRKGPLDGSLGRAERDDNAMPHNLYTVHSIRTSYRHHFASAGVFPCLAGTSLLGSQFKWKGSIGPDTYPRTHPSCLPAITMDFFFRASRRCGAHPTTAATRTSYRKPRATAEQRELCGRARYTKKQHGLSNRQEAAATGISAGCDGAQDRAKGTRVSESLDITLDLGQE